MGISLVSLGVVLCAAYLTTHHAFAATSLEDRTLGEYVRYFEPLALSLEDIHARHEKVRRSNSDSERLELSFIALERNLDLVLYPAAKYIFSPNFRGEVRDNGFTRTLDVDKSVFYRGHLRGQRQDTDVRAVIQNGQIRGSILTRDASLHIEPAHKYFNDADFTHVIYKFDDVTFDFANATKRKVEGESYGKMLEQQRVYEAQSHYRGTGSLPKQRTRRAFDKTIHNTCEVALVADHLFYAADGESLETTTTNVLINHLEAVNKMYKFTDFTDVGVGIQFAIRQIIIYTDTSSPNPFKTGTDPDDANGFLNILSLGEAPTETDGDDWDHVCLAHGFTHRDFADGILGLAWVGAENAGICAKAATFSGERKTLNTGITTSLNFAQDVLPLVIDVTLAHEFGHNFGSKHDKTGDVASTDGSSCAPGGANGNYIMYERATDGDLTNNDQFSKCSRDFMGTLVLSKAEQCFTNAGGDPICGNGIVEISEECDCGVQSTTTPTTEITASCNAVDSCCSTDCNLKSGSECSPKAGVGCSSSCILIGTTVSGGTIAAGGTPDTPTGSNLQSVNDGGYLCGESTECYNPRYIVDDAFFQGACPPKDWVFSTTTPRLITADPTCASDDITCKGTNDLSQSANLPACETDNSGDCFFYHKPRGTFCNSGQSVCQYDGCTGSICSKFEATNTSGAIELNGNRASSCTLTGEKECQVACEFEAGVCVSTFDYASTPHGLNQSVTGRDRSAGKSCDDFQGYCDGAGSCKTVANDGPLDAFLNVDIAKWIEDNWPLVLGLVLGAIFLAVLLKLTYKRNKSAIQGATHKIGKSIRNATMKRNPRPHTNAGIAHPAAGAHGGKKKLHKGAGVARLGIFFPTVENKAVLEQVMKSSKNEEEAVVKLLKMGYPFQNLGA